MRCLLYSLHFGATASRRNGSETKGNLGRKMDKFSRNVRRYVAETASFQTIEEFETRLKEIFDRDEQEAFVRAAMRSRFAWDLWIKDEKKWGTPHTGSVFDGTWDQLPEERKRHIAFRGLDEMSIDYHENGERKFPFKGARAAFLKEQNVQEGEFLRVGKENYNFVDREGKEAHIFNAPDSVGVLERVSTSPNPDGWAQKKVLQGDWIWRTGEDWQAMVVFERKYKEGCLLLDPKLVDLFQNHPEFGTQLRCPGRGKVEVVKVEERLAEVFGDIKSFSKLSLGQPPIWISAKVLKGKGFARLVSGNGPKAALWLLKSVFNRDGRRQEGEILLSDMLEKPTGGARILFERYNCSRGMGRQSAYILAYLPKGGTVPLDNKKALSFDGKSVKVA